MDKLQSRRGETLVETLAAILIVSLASVVLLTMAVTTVRVTRAAREADRAFQAEVEAAEAQRSAAGTGTVTVRVKGGPAYTYEVTRYRAAGGTGEAPPLTSYTAREGTP